MRADVDLVLVPVTVTDKQGRMVSGLERRHFEVFEDGKEQEVRYFSQEGAPVSIGIVYDVSGSMRQPTGRQVTQSGLGFMAEYIKNAPPDDEFLVVTVSSQPRMLLDLTHAHQEVMNRLLYLEVGGRTALWDAVYLAVSTLEKAQNPRKALLVVSDGMENNSRYRLKDVRRFLRESSIQVYGIGVAPLHGVADMTGGRIFRHQDFLYGQNRRDYGDMVRKISDELRNQYVLGYRPTNKRKDGAWRKIRVKVRRPRGVPRLQVEARSGYYADVE